MPLLGHADPLPARPHRVLVAGTSGAGKTTLARSIAGVLDVPHIEIDGLFHGPDWQPRPTFVADVERFIEQPEWVTEWQYPEVRGLLADRADLVVWLDLPRLTVMRQVVRRTLRRWWRREVLWNGNVEPPLHTLVTNPEHVVRWAWTSHRVTRGRVVELLRTRTHLPVVRLASHREAGRWLSGPLRVATPFLPPNDSRGDRVRR